MKAACGILIGTYLAFAQDAGAPVEPEQSGAVFRVTSTLVQVDAVVTDGKGHNIPDLARGDFEVSIDGKSQVLTSFSYVPLRVAPRQSQPAPAAPGPRGLWPPLSAPLRQEDVRRTLVLMVDDLGLSFESMAFVRSSLRKFVTNQMEPGDLVAVVRTGSGSGALEQFMADKRILLSVIDGLRWNPRGRAGINVFEPIGKMSDLAGALGGIGPAGDSRSLDVRYNIRNNTISTVGTLGTISHMVDALREMPGRKSIVLFSDGLQLFTSANGPGMHNGGGPVSRIEDDGEVVTAMHKLIDRANRAGTVIYTMHATGLQTLQLDASDRIGMPDTGGTDKPGQGQWLTRLNRETHVGEFGGRDYMFQVSQQSLAYLADKTGGLAYENGNDLNWGLDRVLEDQNGYYLLGFHPIEGMLALNGRAPDFHKIAVKLTRPGLKVRSRSGFLGETDEASAVPEERTVGGQMRAALLSPFKSAAIRLRLTALFARTAKGDAVVRNLLHIDGRDLTWWPAADGSASAQVQVLAVATGAQDVPLQSVARTWELKIPPGRTNDAMRDGVVYKLDVAIPKAGAYQIRAAVRDAISQKVGSASQFIEIPDVKKNQFVLTSILLQDGSTAAERIPFPEMTPATRQFRKGGSLTYLCATQTRGERQRADTLTAELQIVREGAVFYSAPAKVVEIGGTGPAVFGSLRLPGQIAPGDYYLRIRASDRLRGKNAWAEQWTDFEVLP